MKKKILITGGAGFIGLKLKDKLKELDFEILTVGRNEKEDIKIELSDPDLQKIVNDFSPDIVFHLASGSNIERADKNKEKEFKDTVTAGTNLINCLKGKPVKIIYLSSQAVYGMPEYLPINESHPILPTTAYGEYKSKVENNIIQSSSDYLIFRVSSIYGPGQDFVKSGVIAKFINKLKNNESPVVYNSFDLFGDFIYIDDLVTALLKTINNGSIKNETFNLGSGMPVSLKEILNILYKYFPKAPEYKLQVNPLYLSGEQNGIFLDIKKIQNILEWTPKYRIEDGLKEMLQNKSFAKSVYEFID